MVEDLAEIRMASVEEALLDTDSRLVTLEKNVKLISEEVRKLMSHYWEQKGGE